MFTKTDIDFKQMVNVQEQKLPIDKYDLVITGAIGAGKSTMCEAIHQIFPEFTCYPEFVETGDSMDKLFGGMFLKKKIEDNRLTFTFQSYILDNWIKTLDSTADKRLFERCIDDSVLCFANMDNKNKHISDNELQLLYEKSKTINRRYAIPSYFDEEAKFSQVESNNLVDNILEVVAIIQEDMQNETTQRIIGLEISPTKSINRINIRNREGESGYTQEQINAYVNIYNNIFDLKRHENLNRYLDIGKLI